MGDGSVSIALERRGRTSAIVAIVSVEWDVMQMGSEVRCRNHSARRNGFCETLLSSCSPPACFAVVIVRLQCHKLSLRSLNIALPCPPTPRNRPTSAQSNHPLSACVVRSRPRFRGCAALIVRRRAHAIKSKSHQSNFRICNASTTIHRNATHHRRQQQRQRQRRQRRRWWKRFHSDRLRMDCQKSRSGAATTTTTTTTATNVLPLHRDNG